MLSPWDDLKNHGDRREKDIYPPRDIIEVAEIQAQAHLQPAGRNRIGEISLG